MKADRLREALATLGELLEERGEAYEMAVIGGGSLLLLGLIERPTADVDVVAFPTAHGYVKADRLPTALATAVAEVGDALGLGPKWLNTGPAGLIDLGLPPSFDRRVTIERFGSLELHLPARSDLVCFKLYAVVDQGPSSKHADDLRDMAPTPDELLDAARWIRTHDPSLGLRAELIEALTHFDCEVGDDDL